MVYGSGMSREAMPVSPERFDRGRANLGMRVVLRNSNTGFFLSDADDWTADEKLARDFVHTATALLFARREKLNRVEIVVMFENPVHNFVAGRV